MNVLRSARFLAVIAIFAMILGAISPLSNAVQMMGQAEQDHAMANPTGMMDCKACPAADMTLAGCLQMTCQIAAAEMSFSHSMTSEPIHYKLAAVTRPAEWHTVPPVSPG
jgi:hypothetical protein